MIERLYIRLGSAYEQPCNWLVWSEQEQQIIASGELANAGELALLKQRADNRPVDVLVSASALAMSRVTLPEKGLRQALKALPFMLEDQLVDNVELMHFVAGVHEGEQLNVIAVTHEQMQSWLSWLAEAGLKARNMVPDCLALPLANCQWAAMVIGRELLLRTSAGAGQSIPLDWSEVVLPKLLPVDSEEPVTVATYTRMDIPGTQTQEQSLELPLLVLAKGMTQAGVNLLTGAYKPSRELSKYLLLWRNAAIAAGIVLVLALANTGMNIYQLNAQVAELKAQSESIYRKAIPGSSRIVNLRSQMKSALGKLQGRGDGDQLFAMLNDLEGSFAKVPELHPDSLRYDGARGELRMQVTAKTYEQIEKFKELASKGFDVTAGAMNSSDDKVTSTLTLRSL
ncbi:MAG: type II secretion system protein GspL [Shewanella sp.]|nr:type II secretion system protein GspL [Shewanella sp.]MCF1437646.1 type II secretion system protein GspL [Shewanella sp.]MCF1459154.1 type II secretion system protein GspL [Shewanella sp.]